MCKKIRNIVLVLCLLIPVAAFIWMSVSVKKITILVDGNKLEYSSINGTVADALSKSGVQLGESDKVNKELSKKIYNNEEIVVTRVAVSEEEAVEEIPYGEVVLKNYKTNVGESSVITEGENGQKTIKYSVTYENGVEVARNIISEEITKEKVDKVISEGIFDAADIAVCVNQNRYVDASYIPGDLVIPNVRFASGTSNKYMRAEAASALENMFNAAENDGIYLYGVSGYRSYGVQSGLYAADPYSGYSAPPGSSEHQLGLAMDISDSTGNLITSFEDTVEGKWLKDNAHKYGFVLRYMKDKEYITKYMYEPWHFRYLGVELATELYERGITLEEYYGEY